MLQCPISDNDILCPAFGHFFPHADPSRGFLGHLLRLGLSIPLSIPCHRPFTLALTAPARVQVGDVLASFSELQYVPADTPDHCIPICAPADGFFSCCDTSGTPYCAPGDPMPPGCRIATLEFMKIQLAVVYEGPQTASFVRYLISTPGAVRKGTPVAEYRLL